LRGAQRRSNLDHPERFPMNESRIAYLSLMREVEDLYYREADLLDGRAYRQWLDLFTDDAVYWMPMRKNVPWEERDRDITSEDDVAWMHDDKATLEKRVKQLETGIHWAEEPLSRVSHLITNVRVIEPMDALEDGAEMRAGSRFFVYRNRVETETDVLVGRREDVLRRAGPDLKIARRKIILEQSVLLAKNLTVFL
jgi:3-phenylpropionate/cinnamic acid dioxygenase small subunit